LAVGPLKPVAPVTVARPIVEGEIIAALQADGHAVLEDLIFDTGSSDLGTGDFASLKELSDWIKANPDAHIGIVGHTDAVGGSDANISLSKKRAASVVERLVTTYGVDPARIEALGAGYLAPRTSNETEEGRQRNRRVEVILTSVTEP
jgi:OOP family OmpA-OmpF porin